MRVLFLLALFMSQETTFALTGSVCDVLPPLVIHGPKIPRPAPFALMTREELTRIVWLEAEDILASSPFKVKNVLGQDAKPIPLDLKTFVSAEVEKAFKTYPNNREAAIGEVARKIVESFRHKDGASLSGYSVTTLGGTLSSRIITGSVPAYRATILAPE